MLLTLSRDRVRAWEISSGFSSHQIIQLQDPTTCAAFSPDGRTLISGGRPVGPAMGCDNRPAHRPALPPRRGSGRRIQSRWTHRDHRQCGKTANCGIRPPADRSDHPCTTKARSFWCGSSRWEIGPHLSRNRARRSSNDAHAAPGSGTRRAVVPSAPPLDSSSHAVPSASIVKAERS